MPPLSHIRPLLDAYAVAPAEGFFAGTTKEQWEQYPQFLRPDGRWGFPIGGFLVQVGDRTVLVDTGFGPYRNDAIVSGGHLLDSLRANGVGTEDVTDVILTHLHTDHIGWIARDGGPTFSNATYRCHSADWNFFTKTVDGRKQLDQEVRPIETPSADSGTWLDLLSGIEERLETWDGDQVVAPQIDVIAAPGHTPGSSLIAVSQEGRALLVGDAVHCPAQFMETDWCCVGDVDKNQSTQTREAIVAELLRDDTVVAGPHFPRMQFGRLLKKGRNVQWQWSTDSRRVAESAEVTG